MEIRYEIENKMKNNFNHTSISKRIFMYYVLIIFLGTVLLTTPWALTSYSKVNGEGFWTLVDALFTASSAFSDTGLVTSPTSTQFTKFGQLIILILIQVGGIGFLSIKIMIWTAIGKKIGIRERMLLSSERGSAKLGGTLELIKTAILVILVCQLVGTVILGIYFYLNSPVQGVQGNILESMWHGLFHTVSAINNAGFDITGETSLSPYFQHYFVQAVIMILFIIGGIGFPVIHDIKLWLQNKKKGNETRFKWSLFTKISMTTYASVAMIGLIITFSIEINASYVDGSFWGNSSISIGDKIWALIFNTFSTRNAGFATMNLNDLQEGSLLTYSFMMFIGSAPSSTAGGIRTTTLALCALGVIMIAKGKDRARAFGREIKQSTLINALVVMFLSTIIWFSATIIIILMLPKEIVDADGNIINVTLMAVWFEVASAFGTTGLSLGITPLLTPFSKMLLIIIMFIGQLGVSGTMLVWVSHSRQEDHYSLPETDITIG